MTIARVLRLAAFTLALAASITPGTARAAWSSDPSVNTLVDAAPSTGSSPAIASDGLGGSFVAWTDARAGQPGRYIQRLDATGNVLWTPSGVMVVGGTAVTGPTWLVSDGEGGAIAVWNDVRGGAPGLYAQRIRSDGTPMWTPGGVLMVQPLGTTAWFGLVSDGAGGAVATWVSWVSGPGHGFAQRIGPAGVPLWPVAGGAPLDSSGIGSALQGVPDGAGGAIVSWTAGWNGYSSAFAQRIDATGARRWGADGVPVEPANEWHSRATIASDGEGGAVVSWWGQAGHVWAQRLDPNGVALWSAGGVPLSTSANAYGADTLFADGHGGVFATYYDYVPGYPSQLFAQHLGATGTPLWGGTGVPVITTASIAQYPTLAGDGGDGLLVSMLVYPSQDVVAQSLSATGARRWGTGGVTLCNSGGYHFGEVVLGDGHGGLTAAWQEYRNSTWGVYAQHLNADGTLGVPAVGAPRPVGGSLALARPAPSPARSGQSVTLRCMIPAGATASLAIVDAAGRVTRTFTLAPGAGAHTVTWDGRDAAGRLAPPGLYFARLASGADTRTARLVRL